MRNKKKVDLMGQPFGFNLVSFKRYPKGSAFRTFRAPLKAKITI